VGRIETLGGSDVWEHFVWRLGVGGWWFPVVVVRGWRMKRERGRWTRVSLAITRFKPGLIIST
jgi:hypothetical protein